MVSSIDARLVIYIEYIHERAKTDYSLCVPSSRPDKGDQVDCLKCTAWAWHAEKRSEYELYGCFYPLGVLFVGVPIVRALLFGVYARAPDF